MDQISRHHHIVVKLSRQLLFNTLNKDGSLLLFGVEIWLIIVRHYLNDLKLKNVERRLTTIQHVLGKCEPREQISNY
jgi:hypothetical protein